jgi:hypothetical protein
MTGSFLLNNNTVAYLIHGQPFTLKYQTQGCWFVVVSYNNGESFFKRLFFKKSQGVFESVTNVYNPEIRLWGIGWGVKKLFHHSLKINFFNPRTQFVRTLLPQLPPSPKIRVKRFSPNFLLPNIEIQESKPVLLNNQLTIHPYDDHKAYKDLRQAVTKST